MATKKEIAAQIEALQAELASAQDDGEDVELWVEHERSGRAVKTRLSGSHARTWLDDLFGAAEEPAKVAEKAGEAAEGEVEDEVETEAPKNTGYFRRK